MLWSVDLRDRILSKAPKKIKSSQELWSFFLNFFFAELSNQMEMNEKRNEKMIKCITSIVAAIKVAILFIGMIATIVVVVADFVANNANPVWLALEFTFLATSCDLISTVQWTIQWLEVRFCCGFCYEDVRDDDFCLFTGFNDQFRCEWLIETWNERRKCKRLQHLT